MIANLGKGTVMMKYNLKSAFQYILIYIENYVFLCFKWDGHFYIDLFLPFELCTASFIFNLFAEALHWIL